MIRKQIRQGDILLIPIDSFPTRQMKTKDKILALGETTGHSHRFEGGDDEVLVKVTEDGTQYIDVINQQAELKHEEHGNIQVPKGKYVLRRQREFDVDISGENTVRRVSD